jgi:ribosome-binding factor A
MTPSGRMRRVDEAMREVLSDAITRLKDPRIGFVTVTAVDTSPDLQHATVWVSVLGEETERKLTLEGLRSAHGLLQRAVNRELRMKKTPQLDFAYDDTAEKADRLERILRETDAGE